MIEKRETKEILIAFELLLPALFYTFSDFGTGEPKFYAFVCYSLFVWLLQTNFSLAIKKWYRFTIIIIQIPAIALWFTNQEEHFRLFHAILPITILGSIAHGIILGRNLLCILRKKHLSLRSSYEFFKFD